MKQTLLIAFALFLSLNAFADSLWSDDSRSLFEDRKARNVGDILNILVDESTTGNARASTKTSKSVSGSSTPGIGPLFNQPLFRSLFGAWGLSAKDNLDANGTTNRSDSLQGRIAVLVKEVLPNGNLLIEGSRFVTVNKEQRKMILTGVVRPEDIQPNNMVSSYFVANAEIKLDGKGPIGDKQKKGLISTIFDWLF